MTAEIVLVMTELPVLLTGDRPISSGVGLLRAFACQEREKVPTISTNHCLPKGIIEGLCLEGRALVSFSKSVSEMHKTDKESCLR